MEIILYSTGCPKCKILKTKLDAKNINYIENNNKEEMIKLGFDFLPVLKFVDYIEIEGEIIVHEKIMNFKEANDWINNT